MSIQLLDRLEATARAHDESAHARELEQLRRAQLAVLRARLLKAGVLDVDEFAQKALGNWWIERASGEVRAWWLIGGCAYYERDGVVCVERGTRSRLEWTVLDPNGKPMEPWQRLAPPFGRWVLGCGERLAEARDE